MQRQCFSIRLALTTGLLVGFASSAWAGKPHNVILFVPDGLRAGIVNPDTAPAMARLRDSGVNFRNSHSLFPTFTTANASVFATGHALGDTGAFSNTIWSPSPIKSANGSVTPFLEADPPLKELNADYDHRLWNEDSLVARTAAAGYSTAVVGKIGPTADFDLNSMEDIPGRLRTLIVDDLTGHENGIEPPAEWRDRFERAGVPLLAPARGDNGNFGSFSQRGTKVSGDIQQQYFLSVASQVVLPEFKKAAKPFFLVYWSRDPDGSQHNQGDSFHEVSPGINGPTSLAAIRSVDAAVAALESRLKELGLYDDTDIIVVADHGFSTLSRESHTSAAALSSYPDVTAGDLPLGFLVLDLAQALKIQDPSLRLFDPDSEFTVVEPHQHPVRGNGVIGIDPASPRLIVGVNGGSDLLYIPDSL
jgi:predicted AlkP superfamily pyrophosphatase or phosphodiesterase